MKYTRYDFKRRKSENTVIIVVLVSVLLLAFLIGTLLSNVILRKNKDINALPTSNNDAKTINTKINETEKFIVIQGGKFAKKENIEQSKKILTEYGSPFTIEEENGTRVLLGIYKEEEASRITNDLKTKNVDYSKITFVVQVSNLSNEEMVAIMNAELEIVNKLADKSIKSIQTDELKNWSLGLEKVNSTVSNTNILNDYKAHINALPKELTLNNAVDIEIYVYNLLNKITKK